MPGYKGRHFLRKHSLCVRSIYGSSLIDKILIRLREVTLDKRLKRLSHGQVVAIDPVNFIAIKQRPINQGGLNGNHSDCFKAAKSFRVIRKLMRHNNADVFSSDSKIAFLVIAGLCR